MLIKSHCSQISNLNHQYCEILGETIQFHLNILFIYCSCFVRFISFFLLWCVCAHYRDDLSKKGHIKYISVYIVYHCMVMLQEISVKQIIKIVKTCRKKDKKIKTPKPDGLLEAKKKNRNIKKSKRTGKNKSSLWVKHII